MPIELRLLLITSSIIAFAFVISKIRKSKMRIDDAIFWIFISIFFISISIFPISIIWVASLLGFESPANLVFLMVVALAFFKLFILSISVSILTEKNSQLVQHVAILEKKINDKRE